MSRQTSLKTTVTLLSLAFVGFNAVEAASSGNTFDSGLFSELQTQQKNAVDVESLLIGNVVRPILDHSAIELRIGKPMSVESITNEYLKKRFKEFYASENRSRHAGQWLPIVFPVEINMNPSYVQNAIKTLEQIAESKKEFSIVNQYSPAINVHDPVSVTWPNDLRDGGKPRSKVTRYTLPKSSVDTGVLASLLKQEAQQRIQINVFGENKQVPLAEYVIANILQESEEGKLPLCMTMTSGGSLCSWAPRSRNDGRYSVFDYLQFPRAYYAFALISPEVLKEAKSVEILFAKPKKSKTPY